MQDSKTDSIGEEKTRHADGKTKPQLDMDSVGCGEDWLREDGNLWYARYPDGSFGGTDYPDLTYKDLVKLQELLRSLGHRSVPLLDRLIDSKGAWMEVNGVTVDPGED